MKKDWTGERLETFVNTSDTIEHLHRYAIVLDYIKNKVVIDIACGEGYGSNIMADKANYVFGIDIDSVTISRAQGKYVKENLSFKLGKADSIPIEDNSVDVVVSFETIEHHDKHDQMMIEIKRVLKPEGILIISTPDKYFYSDKRNYKNKFHVKELYKEDFFKLINKYFKKHQFLDQSYINGNSYIYSKSLIGEINVYEGEFTMIKKEKFLEPTYLIALASEYEFKQQMYSFFNGNRIQDYQLEEMFKYKIQNCKSYRVGNFILYPFKLIKKWLK